MIILGIDPGTRNMGYALVKKDGNKLSLIEAGLIKMKAEDLQFQIPKLIQEFGQFHEYTALQVKKALTGKAKASKEQVNFMVKRLLNIKKEIKPLDISDAMAVAITHAQRVKV
jgi:crossover junction endodeoxyribonuclease RuvC